MDHHGYNKLKDAWHSGNAGCRVADIFYSLSAASLSIFFASLNTKTDSFLRQYFFLITPLFFSVTDAAFDPKWVPLGLLVFSFVCLVNDSTFSFSMCRKILSSPVPLISAWVSNFRALTFLVTAICIFAVDFTIFPRKFAKTETFGLSVMDFGVAFYVICNAIVARRETFRKVGTGVAVLVALGIGRLVATKSVDYYEHVSEYGTQWNFFFTLAACKLLEAILSKVLPINPICWAIILGIHHQTSLQNGLQSWVLSEVPRRTFLNANREGIVSVVGYLSLFYAGQALGNAMKTNTTYRKLLFKMSVLCILSWLLAFSCSEVTGISRRLCNLGYIAWALAFAITLLLQLILVNVILQSTHRFWFVLPLLNGINKNALFFFLCANLLTGMVNINVPTLLLSLPISCGVVLLYCFILCFIFHFLNNRNVVVKFW